MSNTTLPFTLYEKIWVKLFILFNYLDLFLLYYSYFFHIHLFEFYYIFLEQKYLYVLYVLYVSELCFMWNKNILSKTR